MFIGNVGALNSVQDEILRSKSIQIRGSHAQDSFRPPEEEFLIPVLRGAPIFLIVRE